jgi:hypothetical protein
MNWATTGMAMTILRIACPLKVKLPAGIYAFLQFVELFFGDILEPSLFCNEFSHWL